MRKSLDGKRIAIVAMDGFEQSELLEPLNCLRKAGAVVDVISPKSGKIQGMKHHEKGEAVSVDHTFDQVNPKDYDALVLPGGVANPDALRINDQAIVFVKHFVAAGKPVGAICHGPWTLIEVGAVKGRKMTSWPSLRTDLVNAGANRVDAEVFVDRGLVTSRKPDDLKGFCAKILEEFFAAA